MQNLFKLIFSSQNDREVARIKKIVEKINSFEPDISKLSDELLRAKTVEFKKRIVSKKSEVQPILDEYRNAILEMTSQDAKDKMRSKIRDAKNRLFEDVLPEAFAVVREAAKRSVNMRHFDVQLIGGIVLHEGKIAEMTTGEGKTLVATLPAYLNALLSEGVHVITVNDYLAKRDRDWMGPIYEFLGLTVGVIQHDMSVESRQKQYSCDITYGTNNEFGFDYLRDNLVISRDEISQRGHSYAIVDEVDSILVDEARTPLIISGPIDSVNTSYIENRPVVEHITKMQRYLISDYIKELKNELGGKNTEEAEKILYIIHKGSPKERDFLDIILADSKVKNLLDKSIAYYDSKMMESERIPLLENLYFVFEERSKEVTFTAKGEDEMKAKFGVEFMIEDLSSKLSQIANEENLKAEEKIKKEEELTTAYVEQQKKVDSLKQLLKAYVLFHKDVEYVIKDNKIFIVDEFTGRLMPGRRFSDGIHEALEAKERVEVQQETQTHATITLQNYFKMYDKLAGMTGTAETEAAEFSKIYGLEVIVIPTNKPMRRESLPDVIYKTEREKFEAICGLLEKMYAEKRPALVGTVSIEKSEVLSRLLKSRGVPHNVLNAKYHELEAHIIAQAGSPGAITIATNMAGRGTDILLGGNPEYLAMDAVNRLNIENREEREEVLKKYLVEYRSKTKEAHDAVVKVGGLFVLGTERHESRRIDNQLRGRSGRQGDPGSSKFYLSLEDDLMRIFGSDRIKTIMEKFGMEDGQEIEHPLVTRAISTAQKRVETQNFEIRQHLLKYDNVMNQQREMIYQRRRHIISGIDLKEEVFGTLETVLERWLEGFEQEDFLEEFLKKLFLKLLIHIKSDDVSRLAKEELYERVLETAKASYEKKELMIGAPKVRQIEQMIMLHVIDVNWKDYLFNIDQLREGINWRAYGQLDPLIEYQHEAFKMFKDLIETIDSDIIERLYKTYAIEEQMIQRTFKLERSKFIHEEVAPVSERIMHTPPKEDEHRQHLEIQHEEPMKRDEPKVGRNDPCPCGSGKKYKKCCGA